MAGRSLLAYLLHAGQPLVTIEWLVSDSYIPTDDSLTGRQRQQRSQHDFRATNHDVIALSNPNGNVGVPYTWRPDL